MPTYRKDQGEDNMKDKLKKIVDVVSKIALGMFVLLVVLLAGVRLFGIEPHIVLSGSMEPEILTGSLVYVNPITREEAQNLQVGDTVTYLTDKNGTKVTHKIYEVVGPAYVKNQYGEYLVDESGNRVVAKDDAGYDMIMYTTYGINNKNETSPSGYTLDGKEGVGNLASSNVFGEPVFSIPLLGYVAYFVQTPIGRYVAIGVCALLIFYVLFDGKPTKKSDLESSDTEANACSDGQADSGDASRTELSDAEDGGAKQSRATDKPVCDGGAKAFHSNP